VRLTLGRSRTMQRGQGCREDSGSACTRVDLDLVPLAAGMHGFIRVVHGRDEMVATPLKLPKMQEKAR
jgi:hypothetical protein